MNGNCGECERRWYCDIDPAECKSLSDMLNWLQRPAEEVDHAEDKGIYRIFRTKEDLQRHDEEIRHFTRVFTLDHVTVALGRMGFRESKFKEFDLVLTEVFQEYMSDYSTDLKDDKSMEYSRACLDRELKQYTGKFFVPEEERYK